MSAPKPADLARLYLDAEELLEDARDALRREGWEEGNTAGEVAQRIDSFLSDREVERAAFAKAAHAARVDVVQQAVLSAMAMPPRPKNLETARRVAEAVLGAIRSAELRA